MGNMCIIFRCFFVGVAETDSQETGSQETDSQETGSEESAKEEDRHEESSEKMSISYSNPNGYLHSHTSKLHYGKFNILVYWGGGGFPFIFNIMLIYAIFGVTVSKTSRNSKASRNGFFSANHNAL